MTKKIMFLCPVDYFKGGAERSLFDLLNNPAIEPLLVVPAEGEISKYARQLGIETVVVDHQGLVGIERVGSFLDKVKHLSSCFSVAKNISALAKENDIKIIHSNGMKSHMLNITSSLFFGTRSVIHLRDIAVNLLEHIIWGVMGNCASATVAVSRATIPKYQIRKNAYVVHNGVVIGDEPVFQAPGTDLTVGFIGRIHPDKGVDWLIKTVAQAIKSGLKVRLSIRGKFTPDEEPFHAELINLIKQLGVEHAVEFTGFMDDKDAIYSGLDLVCVPSVTPDPLPRSVMESMAYKKPVLAFSSGGIEEMIDDGKTGFIISKDSQHFVEILKQIQESTVDLEEMSAKAYLKVCQHFSIDALHTDINKVYNQL